MTKIELNKDDGTIDNNLELIKYATQVQSRIKEDINSDFILAKFDDEKDKEAIKEMTNNAYLSKRTVRDMIHKKQWKWNKRTKKWKLEEIDEKTKERIIGIADEIFDMHMIRLQMLALLNRNKKENPILSGLMNTPEIREKEPSEETIRQAIERKAKGKDNNEKELQE